MQRRVVLLLLSVTLAGGVARVGGWPGPYWRLWDRAVEDQALVLPGRRPPPRGVVVVARCGNHGVGGGYGLIWDDLEGHERLRACARGVRACTCR